MMESRRIAWLMALGFGVAILAVSSIPAQRMPAGPIWSFDKVIHGIEYFLAAGLLWRALWFSRRTSDLQTIILITVVTAAVCATFGTFDELYQSTVPGRDCSRFDMLADFVGASFGSLASAVFYSRQENSHVHRS